ncbi:MULTISPECIES: hypothetical protein [Chryseobacterium]|uniref:Uncharacterized protein n=1 Tax=Chryseobacterium camelliae TaxID=1265445 RepID=A0ABU0TGK0_9FLAO|nr:MULTISPECIES: hypothetical protein [Chryseobacterium]MDT3406008.1 hypothetical protein [Pseudacidovorax intermedius]MDQ1096191.1 hypothetical protein [Chryseobacterium camelliae]MDQ1100128.1 hypothetical protein [Chryseobacterium sp. SORGH_AS_1048]MDR6087471.1 hypothetical protein [Chryseobacterium sp. SORGH_AS_0909]MDR6131845.1 hypothetical protein [Chryseobacterium sp. SORGH_AS_1175]
MSFKTCGFYGEYKLASYANLRALDIFTGSLSHNSFLTLKNYEDDSLKNKDHISFKKPAVFMGNINQRHLPICERWIFLQEV